jgi:hypothetical protein
MLQALLLESCWKAAGRTCFGNHALIQRDVLLLHHSLVVLDCSGVKGRQVDERQAS